MRTLPMYSTVQFCQSFKDVPEAILCCISEKSPQYILHNTYICDTFKLNIGLEKKICYIGLSFVFMIS